MASNRKKNRINLLPDEDPTGSLPVVPESGENHIEYFRNLSLEDQDEILRMILAEGGIKRIISLFELQDMPGNMDLFFDRVQYHHFLPVVEERPRG
jgi:hypothetical protein